MPDTAGLAVFTPGRHENIGFFADPDRLYLNSVPVDNRSNGIDLKSKVHAGIPAYFSEYAIPLSLFRKKPPARGEAWGFNIARTYGRLTETGWTDDIGKIKHTGWADRGGEAVRTPYLGLLVFE
jgi:hypothetical protein